MVNKNIAKFDIYCEDAMTVLENWSQTTSEN